jgi:hypothetical protein
MKTKYSPEQKSKLKKVLFGMISESEKDELFSDEAKSLSDTVGSHYKEVKEGHDAVNQNILTLAEQISKGPRAKDINELKETMRTVAAKEDVQAVSKAFDSLKSDIKEHLEGSKAATSSSNEELSIVIIKGLKEIANQLKESKPKDYSGFFKDFPTMVQKLTSSSESTKQSAEIIRNLKWNASQQLRDVNGSPINPAIAAFSVTANYDDVRLTYTGDNVTQIDYYQTSNLKATLVLTYVGDNLTRVQRTV